MLDLACREGSFLSFPPLLILVVSPVKDYSQSNYKQKRSGEEKLITESDCWEQWIRIIRFFVLK